MSFTGDFERSLPNFMDTDPRVDVARLHTAAEQVISNITHAIPPKRVDGGGDGDWIYSPDAPAGLNFFMPIPLPTVRSGAVLHWDRLDGESVITTEGVIPKWFGTFHYHEDDERTRAFLRYDTSFINLHGWESTPDPHEIVIRKHVYVGMTILDSADEVSAGFTTLESVKRVWHFSKMHEAIPLYGAQTHDFSDPYDRDYRPTPVNLQRLREVAKHFFTELRVLEVAKLI